VAAAKAIETEHLDKEYRVGFWRTKVRVLRQLDLTVYEGESFGYLGPNGAGKTTTIKLLMGLLHPTSGEARLLGRPPGDPQATRQIGFLPEHPTFYEYLTGRELLECYGRLLGLDRAGRRDRIEALAGQLRIASALDLQVRNYSKGMLQRLGLVQALLNDPRLVVLDEPMSGLDPIGRREVRDLLLRLKAYGRTVFFSTHIIPDLELVCDRVGILVGGRLVAQGPLEDMLETRIAAIEVTVSRVSPEALDEVEHLLVSRPIARGGRVLLTVQDEDALDDLLAHLVRAKAAVHAVVPQRESLEAYFLRHVRAEASS